MSGSIPDRWLRCPRKSLQLLDNKFLIFKTPLSHRYDDQVPDECLFPVDFVFNSMKSYKLKLGLWISLTYTSRFYDKEDVERHDCKFVKIQCRGHGQPPTPEQTRTFIDICYNFVRQNPLEIIGVHCTHGFNRSGFLLVSFLVEKYDWELRAALLKFAEVRPPGIYKKEYLEELYRKYDDVEYVPEPPPLPDWCFEEKEEIDEDDDDNNEEDDNDDDDESGNMEFGANPKKRKAGESSKRKHKKKRREFNKKIPTFMEGVPGVQPVPESELGVIEETVRQMCDWKRSGFPGSQPVSMTIENMEYLAREEYSVSWKADGVRYLMYIKEKGEIYFIDRDNCVFKVENISFPYRKNLNQHIKRTLLDGEMVIDKFNGQCIPRYLVYDIIELNSYPIRNENFMFTRYEAIKSEIIDPRNKAMQSGIINKTKEPFSIRRKEFCHVKDSAKFLSDKFFESLSHEPDGLIFQPSTGPYIPGQYNKLLKWKPGNLNSIDFKLKITKEKGVGIVPKRIGELYVGGLDSKFGILKSIKKVQDLNNKIIECKYENGNWVFMRERTDKSFPNSYETATSVFNSIIRPVTQDMLLTFIGTKVIMPPPPPPSSRSYNSRNYH